MHAKLLRINEARARLNGRSRSGFYNDIAAGLLPPLVKTGARSVGMPDSEIDCIIKARIAGASDDEIRMLVSKLVDDRKRVAPSTNPSMVRPLEGCDLELEIRSLILELKSALKMLSA